MSSLQPIHALSLDSVQQQSFVKYYNSLPEKPPTTVRIFDRNDYYSVHGVDATTSSKEVFSSISNIKKMGVEPNKLDYLVLSKGNFEILIRKLLLVKRYRVEIYVAEGSVKSCDWSLKYKGSPGYLSQLEDILGEGLGGADEHIASCLMAINMRTDPVSKCRLVGVACITSSSYEMSVSEFTDDDLLTQLETVTVQLAPTECLVPVSDSDEYKALKKVMERGNVTITKVKRVEYSTEGLIQDLNRLLKFKEGQQRDAYSFPETNNEVAMGSLAAAIKYMSLLSDSSNFERFRISTIHSESFLHVDAAALGALHVFPAPGDAPAPGAGASSAPARSLYGLLDRCRTQPGKRLLAQWLRQPLRDINLINERLDVVSALIANSQVRGALHGEQLRRMPDLHALARRLARRKAGLQDCYRIYQAIKRIPSLLQCLAEAENSTVHSSIAEPISELYDDLEKYLQMIETTVDMEAVDRGDFLVKPSFDEQLQGLGDKLQKYQNSAEKELKKAANDLNLEAGKSIKLEVNSVNGFCLRVTMREEQSLRKNNKYVIVDAVKAGVRFQTRALQDLSEDYKVAKSTYEEEQNKVVAEIVGIAAGYSECLFCLSHVLAKLDVLVSFSLAALAAPLPYCRPAVVADQAQFVLEAVRHPCLELQDGVSYIPNDVVFKRDECIMYIVTGANMGGKSTWMRSCGAAALLAHCGAWVPAARARVPRLRALCARVGAADRELQAQSTFMREMLDTAAILRIATPDSLVLIDELGRGTSTYEGCGLAWAIAEELALKTRCFCLFATHYHELTRLGARGVRNIHARALVQHGRLVLLHRLAPGPAARSLGLQVAALAALPPALLQYAEEVQQQLETNDFATECDDKEIAEGEELINNFLKKCKEIEATTPSDEALMEKIEKLKTDMLPQDNKYVQSLIV